MKNIIKILALTLFTSLVTLNSMEIPSQASKDYFSSGQYSKEVKATVDPAYDQLKNRTVESKDAIVIDIDDTATSHFKFRLKAMEEGVYCDAYFFSYIQEARSPVIPEVLEFYNKVKELGYTLIFLTGRSVEYLDATEKLLANNGYSGFTQLILKSKEEKAKYKTAAEYKAQKRLELVNQGYNIIASVGDQDCDFEGGNTGLVIKLPNPLFLNK